MPLRSCWYQCRWGGRKVKGDGWRSMNHEHAYKFPHVILSGSEGSDAVSFSGVRSFATAQDDIHKAIIRIDFAPKAPAQHQARSVAPSSAFALSTIRCTVASTCSPVSVPVGDRKTSV